MGWKGSMFEASNQIKLFHNYLLAKFYCVTFKFKFRLPLSVYIFCHYSLFSDFVRNIVWHRADFYYFMSIRSEECEVSTSILATTPGMWSFSFPFHKIVLVTEAVGFSISARQILPRLYCLIISAWLSTLFMYWYFLFSLKQALINSRALLCFPCFKGVTHY